MYFENAMLINTRKMKIAISLFTAVLAIAGCGKQAIATKSSEEAIDRESIIPTTQKKITPQMDPFAPILHSSEYSLPVPLPHPINSAGAEDSALIMPDRNTLFIWFTPDPNAPLNQQLNDVVTGIWVSEKVAGMWQEPKRMLLKYPDEQSLDGCVFVQGNQMWF